MPIYNFLKPGLLILLGLLAFIAFMPNKANASSPLFVEVEVSGFKSDKGQVLCALFEGPEGFLKKGGKGASQQITKVVEGKAICKLPLSKEGFYAVSIAHDLNEDGKMRLNAFGAALEPWGVSKNAPASQFGPPSFDQCKLDSKLSKKIQISLNH